MKGFYRPVAAWTGALLLLALVGQAGSGPPLGGSWGLFPVAYVVLGWVGLFLPFASFAGGLGSARSLRPRTVSLRAALAGLVVFLSLAYGSSLALYQAEAEDPEALASRYPEGPLTLNGLLRLRATNIRNPPTSSSFSTDRPLEHPPNWISYQIHTFFVFAIYSVLSGLLGWYSGCLTTGLSPPARRNTRWALGLGFAILFFAGEAVGSDWVRGDPSNSGFLGAWLPLLLPLTALVVLRYLTVRRRDRLHISSGAGVE